MLQNLLSLLFIALFFHTSFAQSVIPLDEQSYVTTINNKIKSTTNDSIRLYNYLLLSEYWAPTDSLNSVKALNNVLLSPERKVVDEGVLNFYQAFFYANQNEKDKAIKHYQAAINTLSKNNKAVLVKAFYNYAYIQVEDKGYDFIVKTLVDKCIPLSKELGDSELLAFSYTQLGLAFMSVGQFDTAEEYHKKALEELEEIPVKNTVHLLTYFNLVSNYCYKPDSKSAKVYLDQANKMIRDYPNSRHFPNYYYQEAMYYTTIQDYDKALSSLNKGAELSKTRKQEKLLHMFYFRKYNVYLMQKDYQKAKLQLEHILQENILSREAVNRRITFTQLAAVNDMLGNYKEAYEWMKKSAALGDSLQKSKLIEKMNELNLMHQTADKKQAIEKLEQEKRENELINQSKNIRITLLGIALVLSLIIVFLINRNYNKQKQLNTQININHQQELFYIENERKYEAIQAALQGEEQERQRIAQDLHDSIGGMLANIRMAISKDEKPNLSDVLQKLDKSISEMRRISRNLMPETLKNLGLEIALKELCESMSQDQLYIQFEAFGLSNTIPFKTQLALYRISQESISNIIKYAQANNVIVQISQHQDTISLTIEDDGIGFNTAKATYGLGINNIKNRTALINGTVDIISEEGKGTTINVECHA